MPVSQPPKLFNAKHAGILCAIALLIAFAISAIFHFEPFWEAFRKGMPPLRQLTFGVLVGAFIAFLGLVTLMLGTRYLRVFATFRKEMFALMSRVDTSGINPLLIGLSAGLWEEVLFRATLQPIVGIWWGSLIFMLCHAGTGQFLSMNWKKVAYAVSVFAAGLMLGWVFQNIGLLAAIAAHATIDVIGLFAMRSMSNTAIPVET